MAALRKARWAAFTSILLFVIISPVNWVGGEIFPVTPTAKDKCIVCGMFVAKYPDWIGEIVFRDGRVLFFDGCKDLLKYYFNMEKYTPGKNRSDISAVFVTEYYDVSFIEATDAFYVIGSDVYGPMGRELIAFANESDAAAFMKDHKGKHVLRFDEITRDLIEKLD